jgi:hypothetical protein
MTTTVAELSWIFSLSICKNAGRFLDPKFSVLVVIFSKWPIIRLYRLLMEKF